MSVQMRELGRYPSVMIAELVKDRLEAEGIAAFVADEATGSTLVGLESSLLGGIRVLVHASDEERARDVLANLSHPLGTAPSDLSSEDLAVLTEEAERAPSDPGAAEDVRGWKGLGWALLALGGLLVVAYLLAKRFGTL